MQFQAKYPADEVGSHEAKIKSHPDSAFKQHIMKLCTFDLLFSKIYVLVYFIYKDSIHSYTLFKKAFVLIVANVSNIIHSLTILTLPFGPFKSSDEVIILQTSQNIYPFLQGVYKRMLQLLHNYGG